MTVDISQFHQIFFEESFEGLEIMESGLLALEIGEPDPEAINTIFRAAHSIKGGSGTFGFSAISSFTHGQETLLDEMRAGRRQVTRAAVDVLLKGVDGLRAMLAAARDGSRIDEESFTQTRQALADVLADAGTDVTPAGVIRESLSEDKPTTSRWTVQFIPAPYLFGTGNDPVRILRELAEIAACDVVADLSSLPELGDMDAESCYLRWTVMVTGEVTEARIREVFEWVDTDAKILVHADTSTGDQAAVRTPVAVPELRVMTTPAETLAPALVERGTPERKPVRTTGSSNSIRVDIEKVDALINMVGELVITQSMLSQYSGDFGARALEKLREGLLQLERNTRELQESVMSIRMMPIGVSFNRFPRLVRDLSSKLGKQVNLQLSGEQTELDKTVMEKIGDPLIHLVRNALDHGIEYPEVRLAAGKPATGTLMLKAFHEGGSIVIEIGDDGAGLDTDRIIAKARDRGIAGAQDQLSTEQIHELIFAPGFSTAEAVTDVSGRGVGMDVVRRNIRDLGGIVEVSSSPGRGSTFRVRLPLTLAILDGQLVCVGDQIYIVPIVSIIESLQIMPGSLSSIAAHQQVYHLRDEYIPILQLHEVFNVKPKAQEITDGLLMIVEDEGRKIGLFVDELLAQQQIVIKSLQNNFRRIEGISGATILGDGTVALIVDIGGLIKLSQVKKRDAPARLPSRLVA